MEIVLKYLIFRPRSQSSFLLFLMAAAVVFVVSTVICLSSVTLKNSIPAFDERLLSGIGLGMGESYGDGINTGFKIGLVTYLTGTLSLSAAAFLGLIHFQRTLDSGQSVWLGHFVAGLTLFGLTVLSYMLYLMMLEQGLPSKRVPQYVIGGVLLIIPSLILGALRSSRTVCKT